MSKKLGNFGEKLAKNYLKEKGYKIIEANTRFNRLEIDLITKFGNKTIFFEIKTVSSNFVSGSDTLVKPKQFKNLKKGIKLYCSNKKIPINSADLNCLIILLNKPEKKAKIKIYKNLL